VCRLAVLASIAHPAARRLRAHLFLPGCRKYCSWVLDAGIKDADGKGIIDIYGGVKWGWRVQPAHQ
jgi:hypothetical protein